MLLSSTSNGHPIQNCGSIMRRTDKDIFTARRRRQLDRIGVNSNASNSRWEKGFRNHKTTTEIWSANNW